METNMKSNLLKTLPLAALLALYAGDSFAAGSNTAKVHFEPQGKQLTTESGGTLEVKSGGSLVIDSGATFTATGGTLTNPTIVGPISTGPVPVACGATCTLGTANVRAITKLDTAAGSVATLPAATGTGTTYSMVVTTAVSSNADKVLLTTVTDTIIGTAVGENAGTAKVFVGNASTYHSLQMPFAGTQPSGGFVGDEINCTDIASTIWFCNVKYQAGTTPTTPYSASTS
jgi:hypothetical protein